MFVKIFLSNECYVNKIMILYLITYVSFDNTDY